MTLTLVLLLAAQAAPPAPALPGSWVNLGAVDGGQAIAVDTATVQVEGTRRSAWFRLANPRWEGSRMVGYLLSIECTERTVNPMAFRQYARSGGVALEGSYGPSGEGARPAEAGSLMEVAYLALCT